MPSIEERLDTLEQAPTATKHFQDQAMRHLRDLDASTTILLGVIQSQGQDIRRIFDRLDSIDTTLAQHTDLLQQHTTLLHQILAKLP